LKEYVLLKKKMEKRIYLMKICLVVFEKCAFKYVFM
jgi:hypothetical protein